jgi:hypothetical protein
MEFLQNVHFGLMKIFQKEDQLIFTRLSSFLRLFFFDIYPEVIKYPK